MSFSFTKVKKRKRFIFAFLFLVMVIIYALLISILLCILAIVFSGLINVVIAYLAVEFRMGQLEPFQMQEIIGFYPFFFIASLFLSIAYWQDSIRRAVRLVLFNLKVQPLDKNDNYHQVVQNIVDEVSVAIGGLKIKCVVVPSTVVNSFAIDDFKGNAYIGLTEGAISRLSRPQLETVVAYEAAAIYSQDALIKSVSISLLNIFLNLAKFIEKNAGRYRDSVDEYVRIKKKYPEYNAISGNSSVHTVFAPRSPKTVSCMFFIALPPLLILFALSKLFNIFISREFVYKTDIEAVRLTRDPLSFAQALYRIKNACSSRGLCEKGLESIFIIDPRSKYALRRDSLSRRLFSSHPPIDTRIKNLIKMAHEDISVLKDHQDSTIAIKSRAQDAFLQEQKQWLIHDGKNWQGPLTIEKILSLDWLSENCFVRQVGKRGFAMLYESELFDYFVDPDKGKRQKCPRCQASIIQGYYEGVPVMKCDLCKGVLLSFGKMPRLIVRKEQAYNDEVMRQAKIILTHAIEGSYKKEKLRNYAMHCPDCGDYMYECFYNNFFAVKVDRCYKCKSTWFDKDELEVIQYLYEKVGEEGLFVYPEDVP